MIRKRFISWPCVFIFLLPFCQMGALQNVPPLGVPLGMESGAISNSSLTASSAYPGYGAERARLNIAGGLPSYGAWVAVDTSPQPHWIQVDLSTTYRITGVATQGRQGTDQWVTSFKVACSIDGITFDTEQDALNEPVADKVFEGNTDDNTVVYNTLPSFKVCRYVRLLPITFHGLPSLRMELYGEEPVQVLQCPSLVAPTHGRIRGACSRNNGSRCNFACDVGFVINNSTQQCSAQAGSTEAIWVGLTPTCTIITCSESDLPAPVNGEKRGCSSSRVNYGAVCTLACNVGYLPATPVQRTCSDDGSGDGNGVWAGSDLTCTILQCPILVAPSHGRIIGDCSRNYGSRCNFACDVGYEINNSTQQCSAQAGSTEAIWVGLTPTCTIITCSESDLPAPVNGEKRGCSSSRVNYGAVCTLACNVGYLPATPVQRTCSDDGSGDGNGVWAGPDLTCTILQCPILVAPSHGRIIGDCSRNYGSRCNFTCDVGYEINNSTQQCSAQAGSTEAIWVGLTPTCTIITCSESDLHAPVNGEKRGCSSSRVNYGAVCTLACNVGYLPATPVQRTCLDDGSGDGNGVWAGPDLTCTTTTRPKSPTKEAIDEILNQTITVGNIDIVSVKLANATEESNKFDEEDLQSVTNTLSSIVGFASNPNLTEEAIEQVSGSVVRAVDNILNIPDSTFETSSKNVSEKILATISTLTEAIQNASTNNFTYSESNIVLAAVKVDRSKFPLTTAIGGAMDDVIDFSANEGSASNTAGVTSVSLPEAILRSVPSTNQVISVSVFLLNSPKLFQGNRLSSSSTPSSGDEQNQQPKTMSVVASPILTVTIEGTYIKDLPDNESIVFVFPVNQTLIREENDAEVSQRCVYWDIDQGEWSDEGCRTEKAALKGMVSCRCSHLTSFAVLLDIKGSIISKALDAISRIGCIASIICLVITLCILLGFRKLRRKQPQQILVNLSFSLLALYVTFVIGIDRPTWRISCTVAAILLHYFCLASLAWMGVEAFNMYMMFVRVLNSYIPKFLLKCSLIGWGIPLVVVIITVASDWTAYQNYEYCFILPGYSLYFGLILPIGLILSFNGIIFAMVLYKLSCGRISPSQPSGLESKKENIVKARKEAIRRAQNAVAIGTLLGLTWAFGFLSFGGGRYLFNALFAIFNSLQGVFVFLLFGIRQPELIEKLKITKKRFLHGASYARRRSSEFWVSSSGAPMNPRPSDVTLISMVKINSFVEGQASTNFESTLDTGTPLNKESNEVVEVEQK